MPTTPAQRWDPCIELDITANRNRTIKCTGLNMKNGRCGWDIEDDARKRVLNLLDDMSMKLPRDTLKFLPQLAKASLCRMYHQNQADIKVEKWTAIINNIVPEDSNANRSRVDSAQPSPSSYKTRATDPSLNDLITKLNDLQLKYDQAMEKVKALDDQNKGLMEQFSEQGQRVEKLESLVVGLEEW